MGMLAQAAPQGAPPQGMPPAQGAAPPEAQAPAPAPAPEGGTDAAATAAAAAPDAGAPAPETNDSDAPGAKGGPNPPEEQATPQEQAEYERAMGAVETVMYGNDQLSRAIADHLQPEDKIDSTVKAALTLLKQIDDKINMDPVVVPQIMQEIVDRLIDMGERVKNIQYTDADTQAIVGATWEGTMQIFGVTEDDVKPMIANMSKQDLQGYGNVYKQALGEA